MNLARFKEINMHTTNEIPEPKHETDWDLVRYD